MNRLITEGGTAIAEGILHNRCLIAINLGISQMIKFIEITGLKEDAYKKFKEVLKINKTIKEIHF